MFDIFYLGKKPNVASYEKQVTDISQAYSLSRTRYFWLITYLVDFENWNWLWEPPEWQATQRHAWPSQWQKDAGIYLIPKGGFSETNYHNSPMVCVKEISSLWQNKVEGFDYTWHPDLTEQPYIYQFGTQWQKTGGPRYVVPGATEVKYVEHPRITRTEIDGNWQISSNVDDTDFDYTWHPDDTEQPYIYQFGTQWQKTGGPRYVVPGATEVKYVEYPRVSKIQVDSNWEIPDNVDDTGFDYTWHPDDTEQPYIYQFGTQWQKTGGPRYVVPGATEVKYVETKRVNLKPDVDSNWQVNDPEEFEGFDYTWHPDDTEQPYIYQFGTQWQKTGGPRYVVPGATEVKYIRNPRANRVKIDQFWEIPDDALFEDFDYTWHPDLTEQPYIYQFGTQWQKTGGPRYVVPGATEVKYVEQIKIKTVKVANRVFLIDHLDGNADQVKQQLQKHFEVKVVRYFDNYLDTLKRIAKNCKDDTGFIWICSSICDYDNFDFSWHPEQWQSGMLHVFASEEQKFGDTFLMHPNTFWAKSDRIQLLEWSDVNFVPNASVRRWPLPVVLHEFDTHVDAVKNIDWAGPLALFTTTKLLPETIPTVSLWREKTKTVIPLNNGACEVVVPKTAIPYVKTQLYDYPHIDKTYMMSSSHQPLDIVFISNGEINAEQNWQYLTQVIGRNNQLNRLVRSDGVKGRVAAYCEAAKLSKTPWFFAVFAKIEVNPVFDWHWQPDRLQQPKHYIFHAHNPVTGVDYGHMAVIAYNRQLVLENSARGLDFTLDQEHEVVPLISGTARYFDSPWMAWRTAFRECIKLKHSLPDVENEYRLEAWLNNNLLGNELGEWSRYGAIDAVEYYDSVSGDFDKLRLSYDWEWLASYAFVKRNLQSI